MNNFVYLLFPVFTFFGALGSYFFKRKTIDKLNFLSLMENPNFVVGCFFYFLSAVINIKLLQELPYIIVLPCSSLTYVWTFVLSYRFFREKIGFMKIFGISLIIIGAVCIALGQV